MFLINWDIHRGVWGDTPRCFGAFTAVFGMIYRGVSGSSPRCFWCEILCFWGVVVCFFPDFSGVYEYFMRTFRYLDASFGVRGVERDGGWNCARWLRFAKCGELRRKLLCLSARRGRSPTLSMRDFRGDVRGFG